MMETLLEAERDLAVGLLDQAEGLYRRILAQDPRNAIALVGLARVAVERGDDRDAYGLAAQAVELDPENPAAVTLAVRLRETLAGKGQTVELPRPLRGDGTTEARERSGRGFLGRLLRRGR